LGFLEGMKVRGLQTASANLTVPQLLYLETIAAKWLFSQEKATSHDISKGKRIVEPLSTGRCEGDPYEGDRFDSIGKEP
jgi:hypothetical protein